MSNNAIREWLDTLDGTWDGKPRLQTWLATTLDVPPTPYLAMTGQALVRAHAARGLRPGVHFPFVPVLFGPEGTGKSSFISALVGAEHHNDSFNHFVEGCGHSLPNNTWAYEVASWNSMRWGLRAQLLEFLTRRYDTFRTSAGGIAQEQRGFVSWITCTASPRLLQQMALDHRLWPIEVPHQVQTAWLSENRAQLFAEAIHQLTWGPMPHWFVTNEEARVIKAGRQHQKQQLQSSAESELLSKVQPGEFVTLFGLMKQLGLTLDAPSVNSEIRLRQALVSAGFTPAREAGGLRRRGYVAPQRATTQAASEGNAA